MKINSLNLILENPSMKSTDLKLMGCERYRYDLRNPFMFEGIKELSSVPDKTDFSLGFNKMTFLLDTASDANSISGIVAQELNSMFLQLCFLRLCYNISEARWNMIMVDVIYYLMSKYYEILELKNNPRLKNAGEIGKIGEHIVWFVIVIFMFLCDKKLLNSNAIVHDQLASIRNESMRRVFVNFSISKIILGMIQKYDLTDYTNPKANNLFLLSQLKKIRRHYCLSQQYLPDMYISQSSFEKINHHLLLLISVFENIFTCIKLGIKITLRSFKNFDDPSKVASHVTSDEWLKFQLPTIALAIDNRLAQCASRSEYIQKINELIALLDNRDEQHLNYDCLRNLPIHLTIINSLSAMKAYAEAMPDNAFCPNPCAYSSFCAQPSVDAHMADEAKINLIVSGIEAMANGFNVDNKIHLLMPQSEHKKWIAWLKHFVKHQQLPADIDKLTIARGKTTYISRLMYDTYWVHCNVCNTKRVRKNAIDNTWVEFTHRIINGNVPIKSHFKGKFNSEPTHYAEVRALFPVEFLKKIM